MTLAIPIFIDNGGHGMWLARRNLSCGSYSGWCMPWKWHRHRSDWSALDQLRSESRKVLNDLLQKRLRYWFPRVWCTSLIYKDLSPLLLFFGFQHYDYKLRAICCTRHHKPINYCLRVIPTLKHLSDIVSDIPSGSIYIYAYVYIYNIYIYIYQENDKNVFGRPNAFADQNALSVYTVEHERH